MFARSSSSVVIVLAAMASALFVAQAISQQLGVETMRGPSLEISISRDPDGAFRKAAAQVRFASVRIGDIALQMSNNSVSTQSLQLSSVRAQESIALAAERMRDVKWSDDSFSTSLLSDRVPQEVRDAGVNAFQEWYQEQLSVSIDLFEAWIDGRSESPDVIFIIQSTINLLAEESARILGAVGPS